ncbi:hypothetical protein DH86_00001910, partial [Scytalidium sp. 3C]
ASSLLLSTIHLTFFSVETICIRTTVLSCTEYIRCSTFCFIYRGRRTSRSSCYPLHATRKTLRRVQAIQAVHDPGRHHYRSSILQQRKSNGCSSSQRRGSHLSLP